MKSRIGATLVLGLALAGGGSLAVAQEITRELPPMADPAAPTDPRAQALLAEPPQATPAPPAIQTDQHGTRYLSGGVSLEERELMQGMARGFPLRITSARPDGSLVPNVGVDIKDSRGRQVLALSDAGPVVFVALPAGKYKVSVNKEGRTQTRQVTVAASQQREVAVFWQQQSEEYVLQQPPGSV